MPLLTPVRLLTLAVLSLLTPALAAAQLALVSVRPTNAPAGIWVADTVTMTPDGRYAAFCSPTGGLDPTRADTNAFTDVYRRDLTTGVTELVSVNAAGTGAGNGGCDSSTGIRLSVDGRYVAFLSQATDLVAGVTDVSGNQFDLFVRDMQTGVTQLASINAAGTQAVGTTARYNFSDNGRSIVFESLSNALVAGFVDADGAGFADLYFRDLQTGVTELVSPSRTSPVRSGDGTSFFGEYSSSAGNIYSVSADGRYVVFFSVASDLVTGYTPPGGSVLYRRDTLMNVTTVVTDQGPTSNVSLTADGRWVTFSGGDSQVYVRDLVGNVTTMISRNASNTGAGNSVSLYSFISRYPRTPGQQDYVVAWRSLASDLVAGVTKTNGSALTLYARTLGGATVLVGGIPDGTQTGNGDDFIRDISSDGRYILFTSSSSNIAAGVADTNTIDHFRRDLVTGTTLLISRFANGTTGAGNGNGRIGTTGIVVFYTDAALVPNDVAGGIDMYVYGAIPAPSITGTVTSTGGAGVAGVTLALTGTTTGTTTSAANGSYAFTSLAANGSYTVTPSGSGLTFAPTSRSFANISGAQVADFVASGAVPTTFRISGQVRDLNDTGVPGVTMTLSGTTTGTLLTDAEGRYQFVGLAQGGTFTVTPSRSTFTFVPPAQTFANLQSDQTASFFVATVGTYTRYFAEGATGTFFDTTIALLNATGASTDVTLSFQKEGGGVVERTVSMAGLARATIRPATIPGLESTAFATTIRSTQPVIAERRMEWDATGYGSHAETSVARPETTWYLAEGATTGNFYLYYLLQNPNNQAAQVQIRYLRPVPFAPIVKNYTVGALSRRTIYVNGEDPGLDEAEISAVVSVVNGVPIIVERAMYTNAGGQLFGAGHESAAIPLLSTTWFLAEGATGPYFHQFILVANPNGQAAQLEARYLLPNGTTVTRTYTAAANSRLTIGVHADPALSHTPLSATVTSLNGVAVLVERAMWWPATTPEWLEGHNSAGVVTTGEKWGVADGENGGPRNLQTYVLIANTASTVADVNVTLIFEDGSTALRSYRIGGNSRFNVPVAGDFPASRDRRFGAIVESVGATPGQLVVERSVYSDANGVVFAAGSNAVATRLR